jgi:hypothetical protein
MSTDLNRIKAAQRNLFDLLHGIDQNEGMPILLAPHAVETTAQAVAPLRELEGLELPERIKNLGRNMRDAAQAFADEPNRETLRDWRTLVEQLGRAFSDTALQKAARAVGHVPPQAQKVSADKIYPGMRQAESRGVPSIPFGGNR